MLRNWSLTRGLDPLPLCHLLPPPTKHRRSSGRVLSVKDCRSREWAHKYPQTTQPFLSSACPVSPPFHLVRGALGVAWS
jgi:hypothetical protein